MNKLGVVFLLMALVLATVMPMAASPDRGLATETPTPVISDNADEVPVEETDIETTPMPTADETIGQPAGLLNVQVPEGGPDPQAMEEFRRELLSVVDMLNEIVDELYPTMKLGGKQPPAKAPRQLYQELTPEQLYFVRESFGDFEAFKNDVQILRSFFLTSAKEPGAEKGPSAKEPGAEKGPGSSLASFTVIPTPTPDSPGILHRQLEESLSVNIEAGDIFVKEGGSDDQTPGYPGYPCWSNTRPPNWAVLAAQGVLEAARVTVAVLERLCQTKIIICPVPGGETLSRCVSLKGVEALMLIAETVFDGINLCIAFIDGAERGASFNNTQILHSDLIDHDDNLTRRADAIDQSLFDFRNLNLRLNIEANLASPDDDPNSLFTLPSSICIKEDPEPGGVNVEIVGKPNDPLTQEKLRRCGLLEVVSDTVRSTIDMNLAAGQDVNNAEAEFQAAVEHFSNGEWKLAYARFRKAYREAVRPPE
jgi:hypothetical protein